MNWFKNISMQSRILMTITLLVLCSTLTLGWNILNVFRIGDESIDIYKQSQKMANLLQNQANFFQLQRDYRNYLLTEDEYYLNSFDGKNQEINSHLYAALLEAESIDEKNDLTRLKNSKLDYEMLVESQRTEKNTGSLSAIVSERIEDEEDEAYIYLDLLDSMIGKLDQELSLQLEQVQSRVKNLLIVDTLALFLLILLVVVAAIIASQIVEPVMHLTNAVVAFENNAYEPDLVGAYLNDRNEMGQLARAFNDMVISISEASQQKDQFLTATTRFVPSAYLDFLDKESIVDVRLGDHVSAEMAVMFSDIRSFTNLSESMSPRENFQFVNDYLKMVSPSIEENNGFIVKYLGDGMMAIFPSSVDDAVQAAIEKKRMVRRFNQRRDPACQPAITVGIGIHTGHMMVGIIGEERRMQGDAFSDHVNLTSRVESLTRFFDVSLLMTEEAVLRLEDLGRYHHRFMGKVRVLGKVRPVSLYEIFDGDEDELFQLKQETKSDFEQGITNYLRGEFSLASDCFRTVLDRNPRDKTAAFYLEQVGAHRQHDLPAGWDGIVTMSQK